MCQVECESVYLVVCIFVFGYYVETGFSWLLNAIPAADTPSAKLWRRLCGLISVFWQQFLMSLSFVARLSLEMMNII